MPTVKATGWPIQRYCFTGAGREYSLAPTQGIEAEITPEGLVRCHRSISVVADAMLLYSLFQIIRKGEKQGEKMTLTFNRFIFKCWRLHVAACFSGSCETVAIQRHAAKCGDAALQTDLTSSKMLNHKVMRR